MTKVYIHAFCLDETKGVFTSDTAESPIELWVGPLEGVGITWDSLMSSDEDGGPVEQFVRGESGFWYPTVYVLSYDNGDGRRGGSISIDPRRGRFSDLDIFTELPDGAVPIPTAQQEIHPDDTTGKLRHEISLRQERVDLAQWELANG